MKRISGISGTSRPALPGAVVLLAVTSASVAAADDGPGPLGVTAVAAPISQTMRVGALFPADRADDLAGGHCCTASVERSPQGKRIVTARHGRDAADTDLVLVPGDRHGQAPYGGWKVGDRILPGGRAHR